MDEASIKNFLERIKAEGRSSPVGQHWAEFYELLCRHADHAGTKRPPLPLILAASGEPDSSKHQRLAEQLYWAHVNGILREALQFLAELQPDQWNHRNAKDWHCSAY